MMARTRVTSNGAPPSRTRVRVDLLADLAAHLVHGFGHALAASRLAVDLDDEVAGLNAGLGGWGVIDG